MRDIFVQSVSESCDNLSLPKIYILIVIVFFSCTEADGQVTLFGKILRCDSTHFPVDQALIVDRNKNLGVIAGPDGSYRIQVDAHALIVVRKVGFKADTFDLRKLKMPSESGSIEHHFCLESSPVLLPVFTYNYKKPNLDPVERRKEWSYVLDRPVASAQSPITALYQMYSKKGRELQKIDELYAAEERRRYIEQRFSRFKGVIMTGLTGRDLDGFLQNCRPSYEAMQMLSDYELFERMSRCFEDYKMLHPEILKNIRNHKYQPKEENGKSNGN